MHKANYKPVNLTRGATYRPETLKALDHRTHDRKRQPFYQGNQEKRARTSRINYNSQRINDIADSQPLQTRRSLGIGAAAAALFALMMYASGCRGVEKYDTLESLKNVLAKETQLPIDQKTEKDKLYEKRDDIIAEAKKEYDNKVKKAKDDCTDEEKELDDQHKKETEEFTKTKNKLIEVLKELYKLVPPELLQPKQPKKQ